MTEGRREEEEKFKNQQIEYTHKKGEKNTFREKEFIGTQNNKIKKIK